MDFWKMNGAGNDFIIINNLAERLSPEQFPKIAKILCHRRLSVGADGLIVVDAPRQGGDFLMRFYNSDGSMGEMCGNGARCICRYAYETGQAGETQTIETISGAVTGERITEREYRVKLNLPSVVKLNMNIDVQENVYSCDYIELGNPGLPHALVYTPDLSQTDENILRERGRAIRWSKAFPKGANVTFYQKTGTDSFTIRTFERGVEDFTLSCGTGSASLVVAMTLKGQCSGNNVRLTMPSGELRVDAKVNPSSQNAEDEKKQISELFLTGPTNIVCRGTISDEDLIY